MKLLRWFWAEWALPVAIGLPFAALVIWLGDAGVVLYYAALGALLGGTGWVVSGGRSTPVRAAIVLGLGGFGFAWPPSFFAVAEGRLPDAAGWRLAVQLTAISPVILGLATLAVGWRRTPTASAVGYGLTALGLAALLPTPWVAAPWGWVLGACAFGLAALGVKLSPTPPLGDLERSRPMPTISLDSTGVRRVLDNGHEEFVAWADLVAVEIRTTDEGPFAEDVYWLLVGRSGGVAVPAGAAQGELLSRLGRLRDFDHGAVILAMGSTENATFPCWRGQAGEGLVCAAAAGS